MDEMDIFSDLRGDSKTKVLRTFFGAVAGVIVEADGKECALNNGFYLNKCKIVFFADIS